MTRSATGACPRRLLFAALALALAAAPARAQPAGPAPPQRFNVAVRYHITSARDQHVAEYDAMIAYLKKHGFEFEPPLDEFPDSDREDRTKNLLTGTIAPANVLKLFGTPHVETLLLTRPGFKEPPPDQPVRVRLELDSRFPPGRQRELAEQARVLLRTLGFVEAVGYDHRGYTGRPHTRLVGTVPAALVTPFPPAKLVKGFVSQPPTPVLMEDLREQPSGWFGPRIARADLPAPLRLVTPIMVIEVLSDEAPPPEPAPAPPRPSADLYKISADLWALASQKAEQNRVIRMEVTLSYSPGDDDRAWRDALVVGAPSLLIEGRLGPIVTCLARAGQAQGLAALPVVSTVRLPRPARVDVAPEVKTDGDNARALRGAGLEALHKLGYRAQRVRVAIIDSDFSGYDELVKAKRLPATTRLIDLTAERNYDLLPDVPLEEPKGPGHGARCALAAALAAPEAELTLVRIDPAAPHMLREVAGYVNGEAIRSEYLDMRQAELASEDAVLRLRRKELLEERRGILNDFEDEADFERQFGILGRAGVWLYSDRQWHRLRMEELERDVAEHRTRQLRFLRLTADLQSLQKTDIVSCSLVWEDGYPVGGNSPLSRWFDDLPARRFVWFQSPGNTAGQSWTGTFRDADRDGVMEFAPPGVRVPPGHWTTELNFLGWRPYGGEATQELPAGAKVRVSLLWREPHDPTLFFRPGEPDLYRNPLAELRLLVLRQRDPEGKVLPADDFEVVARAQGLPQRLDNWPNASTYEHVVEFTVPKAGRYALRVERQLPSRWVLVADARSGRESLGVADRLTPTGIRPLGVATLPEIEKNWELRSRLFVTAVDDGVGKQGRPVVFDFPTGMGTIGMPADARALVTVGAADFDNRPELFSPKGPPAFLDYFTCPEILAYDRLQLGVAPPGVAFGTSLATPFAAGTAAAMRSAGMDRARLQRYLCLQPGAVLTAPRRDGR